MVHIEKWTWVIHVFPVKLSTVLLTVVDFLREDFGDQNLVFEKVADLARITFTSDSVVVELLTLLNMETHINQAFITWGLNSGTYKVLEGWLVLRFLFIVGLGIMNFAHFFEIVFLARLSANVVAIGVDEPYS